MRDSACGAIKGTAMPDEIELSPEMIATATAIFENWMIENSDLIHYNGGLGDTGALFTALWASWKNET